MEVGIGDAGFWYSPCSASYSEAQISPNEVEESPEFWSKKSFFRVLVFEALRGSHLGVGTVVYNPKTDCYDWDHPEGKGKSGSKEPGFLEDKNWIIRSVMRLTDGKVFELGDYCLLLSGRTVKIDRIEFDKHLNGVYLYSKDGANVDLLNAKVPKPLFKTRDGKDVYPGQPYFTVFNDTVIKRSTLSTPEESTEKTFYDRKIAERWCDKNKPLYSKQDIIDALCEACIYKGILRQDIIEEKLNL